MNVVQSGYFLNAVIPDLRNEILSVVKSLSGSNALNIAKQIDSAFRPSICFFAHTVVLGDIVKIVDNAGNELVSIRPESGSLCCFAMFIPETDICSKCKEHADVVYAE